MKGILIDSKNRRISVIELPEEPVPFIQKAIEAIDAKIFSYVVKFDNGDVVCADPDAKRNGKTYGFTFKKLDRIVWGNALVLGLSHEEDEISPKSKASAVKKMLTFVSL